MRSRLVLAWPVALVLVVAGCSATTVGSEAPSNGEASQAPPSVAVSSLRATSVPIASPVTAPTANASTEPTCTTGLPSSVISCAARSSLVTAVRAEASSSPGRYRSMRNVRDRGGGAGVRAMPGP